MVDARAGARAERAPPTPKAAAGTARAKSPTKEARDIGGSKTQKQSNQEMTISNFGWGVYH